MTTLTSCVEAVFKIAVAAQRTCIWLLMSCHQVAIYTRFRHNI